MDCTPDECHNRGPRGGICKTCQKAAALRRYYANKEEYAANNKRWREANAERRKADFAAWYAENKDRQREYYLSRREEVREYYRGRRAANPGGETHYSREWRKRNPEKWALRNRENQRRRRGEQPVSYSAILEEHGMVCHLCGGGIPSLDDLHMDHVIPLAKGGAHHADNIRPAHALCNMRKSDKILN
jgi:5-methylcytosine-specific restriction endonuclease McrA